MIEKPKISVMIITYNQEDTIERTIQSLLSQKDFVYEICVSDDGSKDRTWEILQKYDRENPNLFRLSQNNPNVGIFENIEKVWKMPTGDLVYLLAGDDECGEQWFEKVSDFLVNNKIDYQNKRIAVYGDYKACYPNGDSFVFKNDIVLYRHNALGLALRRLICNRSVCFSKKVLECFVNVSEGRSYSVESGQDRQVQIFSDYNYYIPYIGNVYYTGIGVSTGKNRNGLKVDPSTPMEVIFRVLNKTDYQLPPSDITLTKFYQERALVENKLILEPHYKYSLSYIARRLRSWYFLFLAFDLQLGIKGFKIKRYLFAFMRRLPHNKPIEWTV